jgi:sulfate/thiosulfate transport system ATP-binding protein
VNVSVSHLKRQFGAFKALDDLSFDVRAGELVALLGPSGSGKSTALRIIAGLERADQGVVSFNGEPVTALHPRARKVGFVFQHYALFRHMTIAENIEFGLKVNNVAKEERRKRVEYLLQLIGLPGLANQMPAQLSGGQRQRVALARALAPQPKILLLDEPFAAIDAKVRQELRSWLRQLHHETGVTSIFVTHDQEEAFALADRVMVINQGKLEQAGTPLEIMDHPATEFIARFVGEANVLTAHAENGYAHAGVLRVPVQQSTRTGDVHLIIRSHDIKFWRDDAGVAQVQRLIPLGDRVKVEALVDGAGPLMAHFPRRSSLLRGIEVGCRIAVEVTHARAYSVE